MSAEIRPKPVRRRRLSVEQRRAALVQVASHLFAEHPFDQVSTEDIARAAGVSQSLIFHYFPSKNGLYAAALAHSVDQLVGSITDAIEGVDNPIERLFVGMDAYFTYVKARGGRFAEILRGEGAAVDPQAGELVNSGRQRLLELMRNQVIAGSPTEELGEAHLVRAGLSAWLGFVQELAIDWIEHEDLSRDDLLDLTVRSLMAAVPGLGPSVARHVTPELMANFGRHLAD